MQLVDEKIVSKRGEEIYLENVRRFGEERVLGVFSIGLYNYGFAETIEEVKYLVIYIPTFEDLCLQMPEVEYKNDYILRDIRAIYFCCQKVNGSELELLYALYQKINPMYQSIFKDHFLKHKKDMGDNTRFFQTKAVLKSVKKHIAEGDMFNAARIRIAAEQFYKGSPMEECFRPTQSYIKIYLESIKNGNLQIESDSILSELEELFNNYDKSSLKSFTDRQLKLGVINIINAGLKKKVDIEAFISDLTATERKAFNIIKKELNQNEEICVSISKLCDDTGISRPIWKNLLLKMEKQHVAEIANMGVKGTYIKFL